jgi:hypothetical protein
MFELPGQNDFGNLHPVIFGISQTPATIVAYLIFIQVANFTLAAIITYFSRFQQTFTDQLIVSPFPPNASRIQTGTKRESLIKRRIIDITGGTNMLYAFAIKVSLGKNIRRLDILIEADELKTAETKAVKQARKLYNPGKKAVYTVSQVVNESEALKTFSQSAAPKNPLSNSPPMSDPPDHN